MISKEFYVYRHCQCNRFRCKLCSKLTLPLDLLVAPSCVPKIMMWVFFYSLKELGEFIKTTDAGLTKPVEEGDYSGLVDCMGYLFAVKDRQATTDEMFEPLKQTIELLKTYDQELPEEVHLQLQVKKYLEKLLCEINTCM